MATYIDINGTKYPAIITGRLNDRDWDNRESKAIKTEMTYTDAINTFVNNVTWSIVQGNEIQIESVDDDGNPIWETIIEYETYDNSDYCIAGDIIDHRNGFITAKMGKQTADELVEILDNALLDTTYQNIVGGGK